MFDPKTKLTNRLADATDLLIDFATLGEYGLEPAGRTRLGCADLAAASAPAPLPATRAQARGANCSLIQESGLFRQRRTRAGQPA